MIRTRICDPLGITHPVVLGGMGSATTAPLVAAVSNAGGFGTLGTLAFNAAQLETEIASIAGDIDNAPLSFGQDAGLIDSIKSVREVVQDIVVEAEEIVKSRLPSLLR